MLPIIFLLVFTLRKANFRAFFVFFHTRVASQIVSSCFDDFFFFLENSRVIPSNFVFIVKMLSQNCDSENQQLIYQLVVG
jgi:hypothetical protein